MNSSEAAEEIVKLSLEGFEVAARITGTGAKNIAVLIYTLASQKNKTKGKMKLNNMLKSGSPLQIFSLKNDQLEKFHEESKKYGVLYTALVDKKHPDPDGLVDIMVRAEDAPKVNRIVERFKLSAVDVASIKSEIEKDKIEEMIKDAKDRCVPVRSDEEKLADDILAKPIQKEKNEISNPNVAKMEKSPLSEPSLENKKNSGVAISNKKPSVRQELKEIKEDLKAKELAKETSEKAKEVGVKNNVDKPKVINNDKTPVIKSKGKER